MRPESRLLSGKWLLLCKVLLLLLCEVLLMSAMLTLVTEYRGKCTDLWLQFDYL